MTINPIIQTQLLWTTLILVAGMTAGTVDVLYVKICNAAIGLVLVALLAVRTHQHYQYLSECARGYGRKEAADMTTEIIRELGVEDEFEELLKRKAGL